MFAAAEKTCGSDAILGQEKCSSGRDELIKDTAKERERERERESMQRQSFAISH